MKNFGMRKILSIIFYHLGHNADRLLFYQLGHNIDRLLWMNSPTYEWVEDKLADIYQWAMWQSVEFDDYYEIWQSNYQNTR